MKYRISVQLASGQLELDNEETVDEISFSFIKRAQASTFDTWSTNWDYETWAKSTSL